MNKPGLSTELIHHGYEPPAGFEAAMPGVHKASTVIFANVAAMRARDWKQKTGYTYGLHGTPTTFILEERIATLEGGLQSLLMPSGLAAIALVDTALLKTGDELLIPTNAYGPGRELARQELAAWGITHRTYDPMNAQALAEMVTPATRLVWIEAPGSITMEFPDLTALVAAARSKGALVAIDSTWSAGIAFDAFAAGADVVAQALTKYPSGGADVMMGSVTTRDEALHLKLKLSHMRLGWGVGVDDVQLVLRSLPTIELRYHTQDAAARRVAQWCAQRDEIAHVLHPALPGSPGHEHWARHCKAAAGLFSVVFDARYGRDRVDAFVDALRIFRIGFSWAGPVSLAVPYDLVAVRGANPWSGFLVRFSIGLEHADDLIADIEQALAALEA